MVLHFKSIEEDESITLDISYHITYNGTFDDQDLAVLC